MNEQQNNSDQRVDITGRETKKIKKLNRTKKSKWRFLGHGAAIRRPL